MGIPSGSVVRAPDGARRPIEVALEGPAAWLPIPLGGLLIGLAALWAAPLLGPAAEQPLSPIECIGFRVEHDRPAALSLLIRHAEPRDRDLEVVLLAGGGSVPLRTSTRIPSEGSARLQLPLSSDGVALRIDPAPPDLAVTGTLVYDNSEQEGRLDLYCSRSFGAGMGLDTPPPTGGRPDDGLSS